MSDLVQLDDLRRRWATYWPAADTAAIAADLSARLPQAIAAWELEDPRPLPGGHVALVLAARHGDREVVVKLNPRGHGEEPLLRAEGEALRFWAPAAVAAELLDQRDDGLTLLLERLLPGEPLDDTELPWRERLTVLGRLAARLHAVGPPPATFPHVGDVYAQGWRDALAGEPAALAELAALTTPRDDDVLVHADLHGGNALRSGSGWKTIDPHAVRGDRHADGWALLDPLAPALPPQPDAAVRAARERVAHYAGAAALDPARLAAWTRLRARAEALGLDADPQTPPDDAAWAARLHRLADALA